MSEKVIEVKNMNTHFFTSKGVVKAVDGVDFEINSGETLAIVGESGCGKSVTSKSILRLVPDPGKIVEGEINFLGKNLLNFKERDMRNLRGNKISMIFQEPMTSLNPVFTVEYQLGEVLRLHRGLNKKEARAESIELLELVGIPNAEKVVDEYPFALSGGMRQRVMIAMALACNPRLLIADEPTTALDVTIQAQVLELMSKLQDELDTAILFITHDLAVVAEIADRVDVMYSGRVVEEADVDELFDHPMHPYTIGLLQSIPDLNTDDEVLHAIEGVVPNPLDRPDGCQFSPRCEKSMDICKKEMPDLFDLGNGRKVRCWLYDEEVK
jgi:oligopeptide/dipeptide ABC transporter ATP-binding protein